MGEVTISVAGRAYQIVCEDGEEDRLTAIAARVDREAQAFGGATPSLSEPRLLLMCALLLADKLDEAEALPQAAPATSTANGVAAEVDMTALDEATTRIEALTQASGSDSALQDTPASSSDEVEPEAAPEPAEQTERRSKSSAAVAAEKDLLSWADRSEAREAPEVAVEAVEAETTVQAEAEAGAENTAPTPSPATEDVAEDEAPVETEAETEARERSERRKRRRDRLARLAKEADSDS